MKKIIILLFVLFSTGFAAQLSAQTYKFENNQLVEISRAKKTRKSKAVDTGMTIIKNKVTYKVFKSARGKYFINKISGKTGRRYRYYLKIQR